MSEENKELKGCALMILAFFVGCALCIAALSLSK